MANGTGFGRSFEQGQQIGEGLRKILDLISGRRQDILRARQARETIEGGVPREEVLSPQVIESIERSEQSPIGALLGRIPGIENVPVIGGLTDPPEIFPRGEGGEIQLPKSKEQRQRGRLIRAAQTLRQVQDPQTGGVDVENLTDDQLEDLAVFADDDAREFAEFLGADTQALSEIEKKLPADVFARVVSRRDPEVKRALERQDQIDKFLRESESPRARGLRIRLKSVEKRLDTVQKEITDLREDLRDPKKALLSEEEIRDQLARRIEERNRVLREFQDLEDKVVEEIGQEPPPPIGQAFPASVGEKQVGEFTIRQVR